MGDNTVLVLVSDNGGEASVKGNSYPFLGNKGSYYRGGMSGTGFVHSKLLPETARGMSYFGQVRPLNPPPPPLPCCLCTPHTPTSRPTLDLHASSRRCT